MKLKKLLLILLALQFSLLPTIPAKAQTTPTSKTLPQQQAFGNTPSTVLPRYKQIDRVEVSITDNDEIGLNTIWIDQRNVVTELMVVGTKKKEGGIFLISMRRAGSIVTFGRSQSLVDFLKFQEHQVVNRVGSLETPFVVKQESNAFVFTENTEKAKRYFTLLNSWFYDYEIPKLKNQEVIFFGYREEDIFDILDTDFPKNWHYTIKDFSD